MDFWLENTHNIITREVARRRMHAYTHEGARTTYEKRKKEKESFTATTACGEKKKKKKMIVLV